MSSQGSFNRFSSIRISDITIYLFFLFIYLFLIYLKLTTQAVQMYTNNMAILLKIVGMLVNVIFKGILIF